MSGIYLGILALILIVAAVVLVAGNQAQAANKQRRRRTTRIENDDVLVEIPAPSRVFNGMQAIFNSIPEELRVTYNAAVSEIHPDAARQWLDENVLGQQFTEQVVQNKNGVGFDEEAGKYTMCFLVPDGHRSDPCLLENLVMCLWIDTDHKATLASLKDGDLLAVSGTICNHHYNGKRLTIYINNTAITLNK